MELNHPLGLVPMTNDQYHAAPGISKSHLDVVAHKSLKHYWEKYLNPDHVEKPKTAAFQFGQATHTAILEPETMDNRVIVGLDHERRSKADKQAWAEYELEHTGKIILPRDQLDDVRRIVDAVWADPDAAGLLTGIVPEQSVFAMMPVIDENGMPVLDENGEPVMHLAKCQPDGIHWKRGYILDLKSTEDASEVGFAKSCANYRYPVQTAWYQDVLDQAFGEHPPAWAFLCVEKEPPYAVAVHYLDDFAIAQGRIAAQRDFKRIVDAYRAGAWPSYGMSKRPLPLPTWMKL